jgi:hypothetical protein
MTIDQIQPFLAARLAAAAELASLGAGSAIQYSPLPPEGSEADAPDPDSETDKAIDAALEAHGVVFMINPPYGAGGRTGPAGFNLIDCVVTVMIAESLVKAHTPRFHALVRRVIQAITAPAAGQYERVTCAGFDGVRDEQGYILHAIDFRITAEEAQP